MTTDTNPTKEHKGLIAVRTELSLYGEVIIEPQERNLSKRNGHIKATRTDLDCETIEANMKEQEGIDDFKIRYDGMVPIYHFQVTLSRT